jgi:hypothetical protein
LLLGAYRNGKLRYFGHSGSGFTEKGLKEAVDRLIDDVVFDVPSLEQFCVPFLNDLPTIDWSSICTKTPSSVKSAAMGAASLLFSASSHALPIAGNRWQARLSPERLAPTTGIVVEASGEVALAAE